MKKAVLQLKNFLVFNKSQILAVILALAASLIIFGPVVFAQFARQTGELGWGYGYGYGYGFGYGWDGGVSAGYRFADDTWTHYTTSNSDIYNKPVYSIAGDPTSENVWVSFTSTGVQRFDGATWDTYQTGNSSIPTNEVSFLKVDNDGDFWFTSRDRLGIVHFDGSATWTEYNTGNSGIASDAAQAFDFDSSNNLWVGSDTGLSHFDGSTWTVYNTGNSDIPADYITGVSVDGSDDVWVGTFSAMSHFDGSTWTNYTTSNSDIVTDGVGWIAADSQDNVWYIPNTPSAGLGYFDGSTWTNYTTSNSDLEENDVTSIFVDSNDNLWVASYDSGEFPPASKLQKFDGSTWTTYLDDDMPIDKAIVIAETASGSLWAMENTLSSTISGEIAKLDLATPADEFAYGYGYGFMDQRPNISSISWNSDEQRYETEGISQHVTSGILEPSGSSTFVAPGIRYVFAIQSTLSDDDVILVPEDTTFTAGGTVDFAEFRADESLEPSDLSGLSGTVLGDLEFGHQTRNLTSDNPVTISIYVGSEYNGDTLEVYHKSPESSSWSLLTTCIVTDDVCRFTTTSFSQFAAVQTDDDNVRKTTKTDPDNTKTTSVCIESAYNHGRTLMEGMNGTDVRDLQTVLIDYEYLAGNADGDFGPMTTQAVKDFQNELGLLADGIVGSQTGLILELLAHCGTLVDDDELPEILPDVADADYEQVQEALATYGDLVETEEATVPLSFEPLVDEPAEKSCTQWWFMCWYWWIIVILGVTGIYWRIKKS